MPGCGEDPFGFFPRDSGSRAKAAPCPRAGECSVRDGYHGPPRLPRGSSPKWAGPHGLYLVAASCRSHPTPSPAWRMLPRHVVHPRTRWTFSPPILGREAQSLVRQVVVPRSVLNSPGDQAFQPERLVRRLGSLCVRAAEEAERCLGEPRRMDPRPRAASSQPKKQPVVRSPHGQVRQPCR